MSQLSHSLAGLAALSLTVVAAIPAEAFTITLNNQWYDVSFIEADFQSGLGSPRYSEILTKQPWYGSEELTKSAAAQTADYFASQDFADLDDEFFVCYGFCDRPFFVWDFSLEPTIVTETPFGTIYDASRLFHSFATLHLTDSNSASGIKPEVVTDKTIAGHEFYAIAELTDAPLDVVVPEPSAVVGLTTLGLLGLAIRKRS